jgi:phage terminase large subunit GpA-like protein
MDAYTDPSVGILVLMCSTQMLKTLIIQAIVAYVIVRKPGPILVLQPTNTDAEEFSKERIGTMVRDCECLRSRVTESKSRDSSNTILAKTFPGGRLAIAGATAAGNLKRRAVADLLCDEVDGYPQSASGEGDPVDLASARLATFGSRKKKVLVSSPTVAGRSRIGKAYADSDQRKPWVPCGVCGQYQILRWSQVKFEPEPRYQCLHCGDLWNDVKRWRACEHVEWRAERPFVGTAGFWISHLYSPWKTLEEMVADFLERKNDRQRYQVFVNTTLAELWEEEGETPEAELLFARREAYPFGDKAVVPQRGLFLTAAVDVQENPPRLEVEVVAWGRDRESWSVDYRSIQAFVQNGEKLEPLPVTAVELWDKLNAEVLQRDYQHASGQTVPIMVMAIDTGSRPKPVYDFALRHPQPSYSAAGLRGIVAPRTVVPVKGNDDELRVISSVSKEDAARKRQNVRIVVIGTHAAKQEIYDVLRHVRPRADGAASPQCYHFPMYDKSYFDGLCSEKRISKESGVVWEKQPNVRNEPLDLKVYNRGAAAIFGIDRMPEETWAKFEEALKPIEPEPTPSAPAPQQMQQRETWIPKRNWFR